MKYKDKSKIESIEKYKDIYQDSINETDLFWSKKAERISWFKKWKNVSNNNYNTAEIKWYEGGKLNACYNCLDRHVEKGRGEKIAGN